MVSSRIVSLIILYCIVMFIWPIENTHLGGTLSAQATGLTDGSSKNASKEWKDLIHWIEKERRRYKIPGMAVTVVKKDKVLLKETFGNTDAEMKKPVTGDTVFPIGSSSKPFTSILAAMLVTDGTIDWDDPVIEYLPYFKLKIRSESESDQVTIRDLLSHRTGFFTMEIIQKAINWEQDPDFEKKNESERYTRESILREAAEFKPKDGFREKHNYSNVSMLAAGMASGKAAKSEWDTLMDIRIFKPLGMVRSSTSITRIKKGHDVAKGYLQVDGELMPAMLINMDLVSPAGGINSSINDMTKFLHLLLCEGVYDGKRLIGTEELHETWKKQVGGADVGGMLPGASYGLGWFLTEWKGNIVIEHAGNALGYTANIALIPDKGIGYVMLSNCMPNPMLGTLSEKVWDTILKKVKR